MRISILTATYNSVKTLRDTLESVLRQTYSDYECIIIDGVSKDGTLDLVHEYETKFNGRLKLISEPDQGIYDAMNKGIKMATGDNNDIDATYGDIHFVNDDDLSKRVRYYSSAVFRRSFMRFGLMPAHPSFYCKKAVYEKYGAFDTSYKVAADFENLLRIIYVGNIKTKYIPKDFVTMRTGGASTAGLSSRTQIMKDHLRALKTNGIYSNVVLLSLRYIYKVYELVRR